MGRCEMRKKIREALSVIFPSLDPARMKQQLIGKPASEIFETIYRKNVWGGRLTREYHSGSGSRDTSIVGPYIAAVSAYLDKIGQPSIVDLGCGDFHVGRMLLNHTSKCIACDIVADVIEFNRRHIKAPNLEFRTVNAIEDDLPKAEVVLVRQVLQHLSNGDVAKILPKLKQYKFALITEHIPGSDGFVPNMDKDTGPDHRVNFGSGLVLEAPPFNFVARSSQALCEVREHGGIIRTTAYEF